MAQRHKNVVHISQHPYGTAELIGYLKSAVREIEQETYPNYPPDDDIDFESLVDHVIEHDPACRLLAHYIYGRLGGEDLTDRLHQYENALAKCREKANE